MKVETKVNIEIEYFKLIEEYKSYGFHDIDEMMNKAMKLLKQELELEKKIENSATLYAEIYRNDEEVKDWTLSSMVDWK
jgi:hypothetical protein